MPAASAAEAGSVELSSPETFVVELGRALGMDTTAEGVEEPAQLAQLREQGCQSIQGNLFGRPTPLAETLPLIADVSERGAAA